MSARIAIVGAGIAGLACARVLVERGARVTVFDKGRSVGGRLATRRMPPDSFDLGAQYFTARDERFVTQTRSWIDEGICARWDGRIASIAKVGAEIHATDPVERFVGTPGMSALARAMATGLDIRASHRIDELSPYVAQDGARKVAIKGVAGAPGVTLSVRGPSTGSVAPFGSFDQVLVCLPSDQVAALVESACPALAKVARDVPMEPCFAVGFATPPLALPFDGAFVSKGDVPSGSGLSWVARDSSKPGRPAGDRWVLHATARWTNDHFADAEADVTRALIADFAQVFGIADLQPTTTCLRRWSFAKATHPRDVRDGASYDEAACIGIGGDWAAGGRVEGAFLSGIALAERVLG